MRTVTFDHEGWFGIVPVYVGEPDTEFPTLISKIPHTDWAIGLMAHVFQFIGWTSELINPDKQVGFPIRMKEMDKPFTLEIGR